MGFKNGKMSINDIDPYPDYNEAYNYATLMNYDYNMIKNILENRPGFLDSLTMDEVIELRAKITDMHWQINGLFIKMKDEAKRREHEGY